MTESIFKFFTLIAANILLIAGVILGYGVMFDTSLFVALTAINTVNEALSYSHASLINLISNEPGLLFGFLFCFAVVVYDLKLLISWWRSFSFTKQKKCTVCAQKMYRETRKPLDRFLSFVVPVKRYRCVGCGKEHLITKKNSEKTSDVLAPVRVNSKI